MNYKLVTLIHCLNGLLNSSYAHCSNIQILKDCLSEVDCLANAVIKYDNTIVKIIITDEIVAPFALYQNKKIQQIRFNSNDLGKLVTLGIEQLFEIRVLDKIIKAA